MVSDDFPPTLCFKMLHHPYEDLINVHNDEDDDDDDDDDDYSNNLFSCLTLWKLQHRSISSPSIQYSLSTAFTYTRSHIPTVPKTKTTYL